MLQRDNFQNMVKVMGQFCLTIIGIGVKPCFTHDITLFSPDNDKARLKDHFQHTLIPFLNSHVIN